MSLRFWGPNLNLLSFVLVFHCKIFIPSSLNFSSWGFANVSNRIMTFNDRQVESDWNWLVYKFWRITVNYLTTYFFLDLPDSILSHVVLRRKEIWRYSSSGVGRGISSGCSWRWICKLRSGYYSHDWWHCRGPPWSSQVLERWLYVVGKLWRYQYHARHLHCGWYALYWRSQCPR